MPASTPASAPIPLRISQELPAFAEARFLLVLLGQSEVLQPASAGACPAGSTLDAGLNACVCSDPLKNTQEPPAFAEARFLLVYWDSPKFFNLPLRRLPCRNDA